MPVEYDVYCGSVLALVQVSGCSGRVEPQLYADNLKCVSRHLGVHLRAARFTTEYVRLVGQELAPGKCVLMSTSSVVRKDVRDWVLTHDGDRWTLKLYVRDFGGHLDTTFRGWSAILAFRIKLVISRLVLEFHGRLRVIRSMFIPGALHGLEASFLAVSNLRKLRSLYFLRLSGPVVTSLANVGAVLSLLYGPQGSDPAFCVVWLRFRTFFLEVGRVYRLLDWVMEWCRLHGPWPSAGCQCHRCWVSLGPTHVGLGAPWAACRK